MSLPGISLHAFGPHRPPGSPPLRRLFLLLLLAMALAATAPAFAWQAKVLAVVDGDTVKVKRLDTGKVLTIRFYGIDAPERGQNGSPGQPYGKRSWHYVRDVLLPVGTEVVIYEHGFDRYDRTVAGVIRLQDGKVAQEELLREGLAWVYPKYCKDCRQWKALEEEARQAEQGLWRDASPMPPWEWRRGGTATAAEGRNSGRGGQTDQ